MSFLVVNIVPFKDYKNILATKNNTFRKEKV